MSDALLGALIGGAFTLAGGAGTEVWLSHRAARTAARLMFVEMLGNVAEYQSWQERVRVAFDEVIAGRTVIPFTAQVAIANAMSHDYEGFYPAAAGILAKGGMPIDPPAFETRAWELHGAAFTASAPRSTVGPVHAAYYSVLHRQATYSTLREGLDAVGEVGYPPKPDAITLAAGRP